MGLQKLDKSLSVPANILLTLLEMGKGTVGSFFPPQYVKKYGYSKKKQYYSGAAYLYRKGYIKKKSDIYYLTEAGKKEAFFTVLKNFRYFYEPPKNQRWDGKWRFIFFDIPEKKRKYRDELRKMLKAIGFKEFQKSIWIYPHKVPRFLLEILFEENIKQYTRLITTYTIEYDKDLKRIFGLK